MDKNNTPVSQIESSFEGEIVLNETALIENLLDLKVLSVYQLSDTNPTLVTAIGDDIYTFPFSYSGGYEHLKAYLLASGGTLYIIAGTPCTFEYLSLDQSGEIDLGDETEIDDELDFSMF